MASAILSGVQQCQFLVGFGDYSAEPEVLVPDGVNYVFDGVVKRGGMRLPAFRWQPSGNLTSWLTFRHTAVGSLEIEDGPGGAAVAAVLSYDDCECGGVESVAAGQIRLNLQGINISTFVSVGPLGQVATTVTAPVIIANGVVFASRVQFTSGCTVVAVPVLLASGCVFEQDVELEADSEVRNCIWRSGGFGITFAVPGSLLVDSRTFQSIIEHAVVMTGGQYGTDEAVLSGHQTLLAWDATAPVGLTVLEAPHPPGLYQINRCVMRNVAAITGTLAVQHDWEDPVRGAQTAAAAAQPLTATGIMNVPANNNVVRSSGAVAITQTFIPAAVTGSPSVDLHSSAVRVG